MLKGIVAGLAAGALWGLVFVAPGLVPGLSAIDLVAGRYAFYGLTSLVFMVAKRRPLPTLEQAGAALGLSVLGFSGYYLLLVLAVRHAGPEVPTLIIGTIPIWVMLLGKPAHLLWRKLLPGLLLTLAGVALMAELPDAAATAAAQAAHDYWLGIAYALAAMVSWTAFAVFNSIWLKKHPGLSTTDWTNWLGMGSGVAGVILWVTIGSEVNTLLARVDITQVAMVCIAIGVGSGWLATILWNRASRILSASLCGQLIVSETLFGLLFTFVIAMRLPSTTQVAAAVLFVLGISASIRAHR